MRTEEVLLQIQMELTKKEKRFITDNPELFSEILHALVEKFSEFIEDSSEDLIDGLEQEEISAEELIEGLDDVSLN